MKLVSALGFVFLLALSVDPPRAEAPAGFDDRSNGMVDEATHQIDREKFDEVESVSDGLGPLYNAQSCRECHQNPTSGGASQIAELRVGHRGPDGLFHNPEIPFPGRSGSRAVSQSRDPDRPGNGDHLRPNARQ